MEQSGWLLCRVCHGCCLRLEAAKEKTGLLLVCAKKMRKADRFSPSRGKRRRLLWR